VQITIVLFRKNQKHKKRFHQEKRKFGVARTAEKLKRKAKRNEGCFACEKQTPNLIYYQQSMRSEGMIIKHQSVEIIVWLNHRHRSGDGCSSRIASSCRRRSHRRPPADQ